MKVTASSWSLPSRRATARGIALVITLAFLALLSVVVLAFFVNVQSNTQASHNYASAVTVKQLADTVTNIVMGQVNDGTRGYEVPGHPATSGAPVADSGKRLAWVSQPGLIRSYDDTGLPGRAFKLYSSNNMVTPPGVDFDANRALTSEVPPDWSSQPTLFTDLNRPALISETDPHSGQVTSVPAYPILDPGASGKVDGFSIANAPGATSDNAAPMPVRWMYVLANGTLVTPSSGSQTAAFTAGAGAAAPTKDNPIVGRVAFWTDDDTCKLNINTASEGVYWDRPWAEGTQERQLASTIPLQNEFNRYNGHPAMTSLSPVFGSIFPAGENGSDPTPSELAYYLGQGATGRPQGSGLSPRVNVASDVNSAGIVNPKSERLYASVQELLFTPVVSGGARATFNSSLLNRQFLEQAKFFLTANSRAPELTLSGKPRIGLWPIQVSPAARNVKDRLIAFCTTTSPATRNASPYYFQRLTTYGGDGVTSYLPQAPSSQHPDLDWGIIRNQQLFGFLQKQTGANIPGFGGNFAQKWGALDRDQILTESLDYIRSSLNCYNEALTPTYEYLPSRVGFPKPGETQCVPMTVKSTANVQLSEDCMGFGRFSSVSEAAIVFFIANNGDVNDASKDQLQAYLLLEPYNVSPGSPVWSPNMRIVIEGLNQFKINGAPLGFRSPGQSLITSRVGYSGSGHKTAFMGLQALLRTFEGNGTDKNKVPSPGTGNYNELTDYPFVSQPIAIPAGALDFSGGEITIKLYSGYEAAANNMAHAPTELVQTITMDFPEMKTLPKPLKDPSFATIGTRLNPVDATTGVPTDACLITNLVRPNDTVRSVESSATGATKGDLRMQAGLKVVDAKFFSAHPKYQTSERFAHSLRTSNGNVAFLTNSATHTLETRMVANAAYNLAYEPAAARGVNGVLLQGGFLGDYDNGPGGIEDGAYINKADDGNLATGGGIDAYYNRGSFGVEDGRSYSPNRQIASAVNFGSLPVGLKRTRDAQLAGQVDQGLPWQTLLFCRNPAAGESHPGRAVWPRDHLYLDLFTMPIVEPYAISEPFSTAGKVNLNYQIVPFTYINRSTALRGVLKPVKVMAIGPTSAASTYKVTGAGGDYRRPINLDETIRGFDVRFAAPVGANWRGDAGVFRSASEICDMYLVPQSKAGEGAIKLENMLNWWKSFPLTGDNVREAPYGQIYPRVTTRSNTFTIHMRVQSLQKASTTASDVWDESRDVVLGEYRGSTTIERYVDAGDANIPDFATNSSATMDSYYRFRITGTKKFAP